MNWLAALAFGLAVLPLCLTPGVSFTLVTERVLGTGLRAGAGVVAGTSLGLLTHALLAAVGLSALVMRSSTAFTVVKLVGAVYLIAIGVQAIWTSRAAASPREGTPAQRRSLPWSNRGDLVQGYLGNVLNPKAAAVYLTIAPQFLDRDQSVLPQIMLLCAVHVVVAGGWLLIWAGIVHVSRRAFRTPTLRTAMSRASGAVLIALGVRTALAAR
ncbi:Lysine exporter protein (LYSE/YGGA) [Kribbella flavida DSM 17836]|uniref:Lysine exporter protein (LYSE/YGGA) n=1 Tax=Kribbella flavida (strain DSM 17836 / JCM 10339 / NBRC 14399) TaxID=479435 RepID=D2PRA7_KRIFD|nr:LysE family translocator [Kribbella flavida]ADB33055.1 Lysine exporter protein (LYSE/YGGA) [Kribbella flavida DSM 17836]